MRCDNYNVINIPWILVTETRPYRTQYSNDLRIEVYLQDAKKHSYNIDSRLAHYFILRHTISQNETHYKHSIQK